MGEESEASTDTSAGQLSLAGCESCGTQFKGSTEKHPLGMNRKKKAVIADWPGL